MELSCSDHNELRNLHDACSAAVAIHASFQDGILRLEVPKQEVQQLEDKRHFVQIGD
jgi:HSP20 family molecular chaperone IbpA